MQRRPRSSPDLLAPLISIIRCSEFYPRRFRYHHARCDIKCILRPLGILLSSPPGVLLACGIKYLKVRSSRIHFFQTHDPSIPLPGVSALPISNEQHQPVCVRKLNLRDTIPAIKFSSVARIELFSSVILDTSRIANTEKQDDSCSNGF